MTSGDFQTLSAARALPHWWSRRGSPRPPPLLTLPAAAIAVVMLLPVAYLLVRSLGASQEAWDLLFRARTAEVLFRTALLVATVTAVSVGLAAPLAWLTVKTDLPMRRVWMVLTTLPLVIPSYVGAFLIVSALGPKGLLQQALSGPLGVERLPDIHGLAGATITLSFLSYPYVLLTLRGSLSRLDPALEESARSLGLGPWSTFRRVTLPLLRPAMAAGALLVALYTLSDFGAVSLLRYETFTWAIYQQYQSFDRSLAALLSLVLVALALLVLFAESRGPGRLRYHQAGGGAPRRLAIVRLRRWKWPALAFCSVVTAVSLVLPVSVLLYWLVRGVSSGEPLAFMWGALANSVYVSALAAIVAAACSIPVGVLIVRYPGLASRALERLSFTGYALPGIVVALSLVFFGVNFARPIYQTVWLLLLAYMVLFFPAALGATRASLLQVSPRLEEMARGLGRSPLQTMMAVTVPLVRPGVISGAALVFLITMKELPATLILSPLGFKTLATAIWSASSEAFFAQAAAPALLLILVSSAPLAVLVTRDKGMPR